MFELALEIANMKKSECTAQAIQNLFARYGIYRSADGAERGYENFWWDANFIFFDRENSFYKTLSGSIREQEQTSPGWKATQKCFAPGDEHYAEILWACVSETQEAIRDFFDHFIAGDPYIDGLRKLCEDAKMSVYCYEESNDTWNPGMGMMYSTSSTKHYILSREIVATFFRGEGENFQRIRRCQECGRYFYANDIRKIFCTSACRVAANNKLRKQ